MHSSYFHHALGIVAALAILGPGGQELAQAGDGSWALFDLGTLGGDWSRPYDINENGEIVGISQLNPESDLYHGWYWNLDNGKIDIDPTNEKRTKARAISDIGTIAGWAAINNSGPHAIRKIKDGPVENLGTFGGPTSKARGINQAGVIVGFAEDAGRHMVAFRWDSFNQMVPLGNLANGDESEARSINNFGDIAGWSNLAHGAESHAFLWESATSIMRDLGTLGGLNSFAYGVNDSSMVVGDSNNTQGNRNAFVWADGVMQNLGTFGGKQSLARGVNNLGQVVGRAMLADGTWHGFRWDAVNGMIDVNDLLPVDTQWVVSEIRAINDFGYMVGSAQLNGDPIHAILLAPPLVMDKPIPGLAGRQNSFNLHGAVPNATVYLLASTRQGKVRVPFCNSLTIDLSRPVVVIGSRIASNSGDATAKRFVADKWKGRRVFLQAVETTEMFGCRSSVLATYKFPE